MIKCRWRKGWRRMEWRHLFLENRINQDASLVKEWRYWDTTTTRNDCLIFKNRKKKKEEIRKLKRLARFLHSYILTQIWSILWCIIENHLKDSEITCLFKEKKIDDFDFYLAMKKKKEHFSLLCSLLRFDMKQSCLSVVCEPESALSL